ncbi:hypothetical protein [Marinimicrobium koreense]|uniref:hypothetical protein n=1 Tax=Marinimicrobium koreense TaxID=306545 RepID=UPI003F709B5C
MKNLMRSFLLLALTFLASIGLAMEQMSPGMMQDSGMMGAGFMLACIVLLILLLIALVLAILSMIKYLFFSKSKKGDRS